MAPNIGSDRSQSETDHSPILPGLEALKAKKKNASVVV